MMKSVAVLFAGLCAAGLAAAQPENNRSEALPAPQYSLETLRHVVDRKETLLLLREAGRQIADDSLKGIEYTRYLRELSRLSKYNFVTADTGIKQEYFTRLYRIMHYLQQNKYRRTSMRNSARYDIDQYRKLEANAGRARRDFAEALKHPQNAPAETVKKLQQEKNALIARLEADEAAAPPEAGEETPARPARQCPPKRLRRPPRPLSRER